MPTLPPTHSTKVDGPTHRPREYTDKRGANARGYNYRWQQARLRFLGKHPLCIHCLAEKPQRVVKATEVDHIVPHRGNDTLFWDVGNWQPLCKSHHSAKTARENGGFGNA